MKLNRKRVNLIKISLTLYANSTGIYKYNQYIRQTYSLKYFSRIIIFTNPLATIFLCNFLRVPTRSLDWSGHEKFYVGQFLGGVSFVIRNLLPASWEIYTLKSLPKMASPFFFAFFQTWWCKHENIFHDKYMQLVLFC